MKDKRNVLKRKIFLVKSLPMILGTIILFIVSWKAAIFMVLALGCSMGLFHLVNFYIDYLNRLEKEAKKK